MVKNLGTNDEFYFFSGFNEEKKKNDKKPFSNDEKGNHFCKIRKYDKSKRYDKKRLRIDKRTSLLFNMVILSILNIYLTLSQNTNELTYSYVLLKVVKGTNKVYSNLGGNKDRGCYPAFTKPDEIIINRKSVENKPLHTFTEEENIVKLIWKRI